MDSGQFDKSIAALQALQRKYPRNANATVTLAPKTSAVAVGADGKPKTAAHRSAARNRAVDRAALIAAEHQGAEPGSLHEARKTLVAAIAKPEGPFREHNVPLLPWLVALDAAGHLDGVRPLAVRPRVSRRDEALERRHRGEIDAMAKWAMDHPLFWK